MSRWTKTVIAIILTTTMRFGSHPAWGFELAASPSNYCDSGGITSRDGRLTFGPDNVEARGDGGQVRKLLADALAAIGGGGRTLVVSPGNWTIDSDLEIPANVTLKPEPGAMIVIPITKTLTIKGPLEAGHYQIFSWAGTGKVVFGPGAVKELVPQWWGAKGDGVTDDTTALQAMIDCSVNSKVGFFLPPGVYRTADQLTTSGTLCGVTWRGSGSGGGAKGRWNDCAIIKYDGPMDATKAVFRVDEHNFTGNSISGITFDANKKAGYAMVLSGTTPLTSKAMNNFNQCSFGYASVAGVVLGNTQPSKTTNDIDGNDNNFYLCNFVSNVYGFIGNAQNLYNTAFYSCNFTYYHVSDRNITKAHFWAIKGWGFRFYNPFFAPSTNKDFQAAIYAGVGGISIHGGWSEESRVLKTDGTYGGFGAVFKNISIDNLSVNESSGDGNYSIYAPYGSITIRDCEFATHTHYRKIYVAGKLRAANVELGANGAYELDSPHDCEIEGFHPGRLRTLNPNPILQHWLGTAPDELPLGYAKLSGPGYSGTVSRSKEYAVNGDYTAHCVCTAKGSNYGIGLRIEVAHLEPFRRQRLVAVVTGTYKTGDFVKLYGLLGLNVSGTTGLSFIDLGKGKFLGYSYKTIGATDTRYYIYTGLKDVGECWIDSITVFPAGTLSPAAYKAIGGYGAWDNFHEEALKAGYVPVGKASPANRIITGPGAPTTGTWAAGDLCFNSTPASGQPIGWQCKIGGSPGTWGPMGNMP